MLDRLVRLGFFLAIAFQIAYSECPSGFSPNREFCYYASMEQKTWLQASLDCIFKNGHLISIDSENKAEVIQMYTAEYFPGDSEKFWWVSLDNRKTKGTYPWNRSDNEDGNSAPTNPSCAAIRNLKLEDLDCGLPGHYICETLDVAPGVRQKRRLTNETEELECESGDWDCLFPLVKEALTQFTQFFKTMNTYHTKATNVHAPGHEHLHRMHGHDHAHSHHGHRPHASYHQQFHGHNRHSEHNGHHHHGDDHTPHHGHDHKNDHHHVHLFHSHHDHGDDHQSFHDHHNHKDDSFPSHSHHDHQESDYHSSHGHPNGDHMHDDVHHDNNLMHDHHTHDGDGHGHHHSHTDDQHGHYHSHHAHSHHNHGDHHIHDNNTHHNMTGYHSHIVDGHLHMHAPHNEMEGDDHSDEDDSDEDSQES